MSNADEMLVITHAKFVIRASKQKQVAEVNLIFDRQGVGAVFNAEELNVFANSLNRARYFMDPPKGQRD